MTGTRVVLVPGALALLPAYASLEDPVAELRAACRAAVGWLGTRVTVLADDQGRRVGEHLLAVTDRSGDVPSYLVVANGSARRSEHAPGHLDPRAAAFDAGLLDWLHGSDARSPGGALDVDLARELWASVTGLELMATELPGWDAPRVDYDDDPFGVQYWVLRWTCAS